MAKPVIPLTVLVMVTVRVPDVKSVTPSGN
jgi:hypothetical protein